MVLHDDISPTVTHAYTQVTPFSQVKKSRGISTVEFDCYDAAIMLIFDSEKQILTVLQELITRPFYYCPVDVVALTFVR